MRQKKPRPLIERLAMAAQSGRAGNLRSVEATCREAIAHIQQLEADSKEDEQLREKMSGILTKTANALKGKPRPLSSHSWHDLPEVAAQLRTRHHGDSQP